MSLVSGKYWTGDPKIKPDAWGPVEDVKSQVLSYSNFYRLPIYDVIPFWEKSGSIIHNYGPGNRQGSIIGMSWDKDSLNGSNNSDYLIFNPASVPINGYFFEFTPKALNYNNGGTICSTYFSDNDRVYFRYYQPNEFSMFSVISGVS